VPEQHLDIDLAGAGLDRPGGKRVSEAMRVDARNLGLCGEPPK